MSTPQSPGRFFSVIRMSAALALFLAFVPRLADAGGPAGKGDSRTPRGIYAVVNVLENIKKEQAANPSITRAQLEAYFVKLYKDLLDNPAVSGIAIWVDWNALNPGPPKAAHAYDWSVLDDAFNAASSWNAGHPAKPPKTIQLIPLPGFQTPDWVLRRIPSCDGLFQPRQQKPPANCGKATFAGFVEGGGVRELPMPWNPIYKRSWRNFLTVLAARYRSKPEFVSISVAGPTASSEEMILPNNANTPRQEKFGGILPNAMWLRLLAFHYRGKPAYQRSDQAFIDEWKAAIDMYGEIFSGVTLIATTGSGFPNLGVKGFAVPAEYRADCPNPNMDCAAETTILSYFQRPTVGGANAKAAQEDGMEASRVSLGRFNLGVDGIKLISRNKARVLCGAQFNYSFANFPLQQGCPSKFPPRPNDRPAGCSMDPTCKTAACIPVACIPRACLAPGVTPADLTSFGTFNRVPVKSLMSREQAAYNVLRLYFDGTPAGPSFGGTSGTASFNYLQIYAADFLYATANAHAPAQVVSGDGASIAMSAQDLLDQASRKLFEIAAPASKSATARDSAEPARLEPAASGVTALDHSEADRIVRRTYDSRDAAPSRD